MSRFFFGYVTVSSTFGNFGKLTRSTPSISTKSSATTSSSRWAPGLRIARNSSNCGSVVGSVTVLAPCGALADRLGTVADRLGGDNHRYPRAMSGSYSSAQKRIVNAALDLFAEHGVGGTSLQMIADSLGVTKAAIYHQFKTKDEIVLAAAAAELANLEAAIVAAEAEPDRSRARDVLVARIVDLAVERRRMESTLLVAPVIVQFFAHSEPFRQVMDRLYRLLMGDDAGPDARVPAAMLTAAIGGAVMHPIVAGLDDETLRTQLLRLAR